MNNELATPRLVVSGLSGGGGKTLVTLGLVRAFAQQGLRVAPYKKGPDYIDAAWLGLAAGRSATNLDQFFLAENRIRALFANAATTQETDLAIIEGNRGLYDGRDLEGSCSTAALARVLEAPVLLVLSVTKMTRTAAAVIGGLKAFEPVNLAGIVLNRVASSRHAALIRRSIESYTDIPVVGEIPRLPRNPLPERHMGLVSMHSESGQSFGMDEDVQEAQHILDGLGQLLKTYANLEDILNIARTAPALREIESFWPDPCSPEAPDTKAPIPPEPIPVSTHISRETTTPGSSHPKTGHKCQSGHTVRIGYVHDAALWFYYKENLEALRRAGAEVVELGLLDPEPWPGFGRHRGQHLDGLYLGGGFPEMLPGQLSASPHLAEIRTLSLDNRPIYAECGGFMILCRELRVDDFDYPMAGIFPARTVFHLRPQGLGYVEACVEQANPFHPVGITLRGHEFHYSSCVPLGEMKTIMRLSPGVGMSAPRKPARMTPVTEPCQSAPNETLHGRDGLLVRQTFAAYTHIFAPAVPHWATNFVAACKK